MIARAWLWFVCATLIFASANASAQDLIEPTQAQLELADQAYAAFEAEDWERAIRLYQAVLDLGPLNSAYASLGYAMLKAGYCEEARASFELSESAPQVVEPPPEAVAQALEVYRERMNEICPGFILMECRPRDLQISVDGSSMFPCSSNPVPLARGDHVIIAAAGEESIQRDVYVSAFETQKITLVIEGVESAQVRDVAVSTAVTQGTGSSQGPSVLSWVVLGSGAAVLTAALAVDLVVLDASLDELRRASANGDLAGYQSARGSVDTEQTLVRGMVIGGGILVAAGITLWITDALSDTEDSALSAGAGPGGALVRWRW